MLDLIVQEHKSMKLKEDPEKFSENSSNQNSSVSTVSNL